MPCTQFSIWPRYRELSTTSGRPSLERAPRGPGWLIPSWAAPREGALRLKLEMRKGGQAIFQGGKAGQGSCNKCNIEATGWKRRQAIQPHVDTSREVRPHGRPPKGRW